MNEALETLAMMVGPAGHILRYCKVHRAWLVGTAPVSEDAVRDLLLRGWVRPTRKPTISGDSLTGRCVITGKGRRALYIWRRDAAARWPRGRALEDGRLPRRCALPRWLLTTQEGGWRRWHLARLIT